MILIVKTCHKHEITNKDTEEYNISGLGVVIYERQMPMPFLWCHFL